jgi:MarR family transcriptional repressor of emrRAB
LRSTRPTFASSPTLSTLLALSGRLVQERIGRDLEPLGISYAQAAVLVRLWRRDGEMPQAEMIQSLALSRTSVTQVLNDLAQRRLIERHPAADDARRLVVRLTEEGMDLEPPVLRVFERVEVEIRATLAEEDVESAFKVLLAVLEGIRQDRRA